jgi:hypothetical protein
LQACTPHRIFELYAWGFILFPHRINSFSSSILPCVESKVVLEVESDVVVEVVVDVVVEVGFDPEFG